MRPIATLLTLILICFLFWLDRDKRHKASRALIIPILWLLIIGSHPITVWAGIFSGVSNNQAMLDSAAQSQQSATPASDVGTESSSGDAAFYGLMIASAAVVLYRRRRTVMPVIKANLPIICFLSYCALSALWSDFPFIAFKRWGKTAGEFMMVLVVFTDPLPERAIKKFFTAAGFILIPLSILFIKYYPDYGLTLNIWTWESWYNGVTENKNMLGMLSLVSGLNSMWCLQSAFYDKRTPNRFRVIAAHTAVVVMVSGLLLIANSMTSLSCFCLANFVLFVIFLPLSRGKKIIVHSVVAFCVLLAIFALFLDSSGSMVQSLGRNSTLTGRTAIWNAVLSTHTNPLIGTGFESFWTGDRMRQVWALTAEGIQEAHDGYIEVYINLGFLGLVFLGAAILHAYRSLLREFALGWHTARLRLALLASGLIYSLSEAGFRQLSIVWLSFLFALTVVPHFQQSRLANMRSNFQQLRKRATPSILGIKGASAFGHR